MLQALRTVARVAVQRTAVAARPATLIPARAFTVSAVRLTNAKQEAPRAPQASSLATPDEAAEGNFPADLPLRTDEDGVRWADYRPENLRNIQAVRNADGDMVGKFEGEDVIFPDLEPTLEWVLSTPVDLHLFEEAPVIKMYLEESTQKH